MSDDTRLAMQAYRVLNQPLDLLVQPKQRVIHDFGHCFDRRASTLAVREIRQPQLPKPLALRFN